MKLSMKMTFGPRMVLVAFAAMLLATAPSASLAGVTITWTYPADGTVFIEAPANIQLRANASANQGYTISKVEFFHGATLIGTDTTVSSVAVVDWLNVQPGVYALTAKATAVKKSNPDQTATSTAVKITVNAPPTVTLTNPTDRAVYSIPPPVITVSATASDVDGSIAKVEFFDCGATAGLQLLATVTSPPYSFAWTPAPPYYEGDGRYKVHRIDAYATDNLGAQKAAGCISVFVLPTFAITSPANGATFSAPATIVVDAALTPPDEPLAKVQFYNGTTLIGEDLTAPFSFTWQGVAAGNYSLTAKAISADDPEGFAYISAPINVTVIAQAASLHFIHVDHLNTPRLVANGQGQTVWRWDQQEPFGVNVPDENPSGLGVFDLPLRLPGQYFDKETNLHYNYHRDYDPSIGSYKQSDPIGLAGGLNTYAYVLGSPLFYVDPLGLDVMVCYYSDAALALGHIGFGVGSEQSTSGYHPTGNPFGSPGIVKKDEYAIKECKILPANPEQDDCMLKCRAERAANPGTYHVTRNQCTGFVRDCLFKCGLWTGGSSGSAPRPLFLKLPGTAN